MKKVFLENLPKKEGIGANKGVLVINWSESIGYKIYFIYDDVEGQFEIINYKSKSQRIIIKYLDNPLFETSTSQIIQCGLGGLLGKYGRCVFKCEIGQTFKGDGNDRNITITDREIRPRTKKNGSICNDKYYKYICNKCGNEDYASESHIINSKSGCNVCCHHPKPKLGINTVWDKARWMCDLGVSEEDAKKYSYGCTDKIIPVCPDCGRIKDKPIAISAIYYNHSIGCICGDGVSYPEKIMASVLSQLYIDFKTEYAPKWCEYIRFDNINKTKTGRYDFLLKDISFNNRQVIVETDGSWHKRDNKMSGIKKEESEYIDFTKDKLANDNGFEVIRIDCGKSKLEFIKQNILSSKLNELFDLSQIDWQKCEEFALSNRVKEACNLWNDGIESAIEIAKIMKLSKTTILGYLKKGTGLWCNYTVKVRVKTEKTKKIRDKIIKEKVRKRPIPIEMFKDGISLGIFPSATYLEKNSESLFGVKLTHQGISSVCVKRKIIYKGYTFLHVFSQDKIKKVTSEDNKTKEIEE